MGKQSKTIRNKRKIKVENYENAYVDNSIEKKVSKAFTREAQFTIVSIFLVTIVMISSAYAIFSSVQKQETYNTLTVGTLKIDFDQSSTDMGNIINLNGAYPTSDTEGQKTSPYSFKITNSGTLDAYYKVKIIDDTDIITEDGCSNNLLPKDKIKVSINGGAPFLLNSKEANSYIVNDGTLAASESRTFEIRIWIDETAGNEVLGKHYHGKIVVEGENTTSSTDSNILCKRATELHTETCGNSSTTGFCQADGYTSGAIIQYGNETITEGSLNTGDAFDCDVDGDSLYGEKDVTTGKYVERFYYVTDMDSNTAVLIYYNNVSGGEANNSTAYAYNTNTSGYLGPEIAIEQLPTTTQWKKVSLTNTIRNITDENGTIRVTGFNYGNKAARLLTYQEAKVGCNNETIAINSKGGLSIKCKFLYENTKYSNASMATYGPWLENVRATDLSGSWVVYSSERRINSSDVGNSTFGGVRPVIEVPKSKILY